MMKYKLAALDMDGTLLMDDKRLHPDTAADLKAAHDRGLEIVYCTGRAVPEVAMYREELPFIRYGVCMSGAVLYDFEEGKCLFRKCIEKRYVLQIAKTVEENGGMLQFLTDKVSIARADQIPRMSDYCAGDLQELFEKTAVPAEDMLAEAKKYGDLPKVNAFFPSPGQCAVLAESLKGMPAAWDFLGKTAVEIRPEGISKAGGLKRLAELFGIGMQEVIAVGDSYNDIGMIEAAGFGAAMGNARPEVRKICGLVVPDNNHNGVGYALREAIR